MIDPARNTSTMIGVSVGVSTVVRIDSTGGAPSNWRTCVNIFNTSSTQTLLIRVNNSTTAPTISATECIAQVGPRESKTIFAGPGLVVWGVMDSSVAGTATIRSSDADGPLFLG